MTALDLSDLSKKRPERALTEPLHRSGGRNNKGRITIWFRGGGHKRNYRVVDFRRDKRNVPAKVAALEYDPNRSARLALLHYADGDKRYILAPEGMKVGQTVVSGDGADILPGNALPLKMIRPAPAPTTRAPDRRELSSVCRRSRRRRRVRQAASGEVRSPRRPYGDVGQVGKTVTRSLAWRGRRAAWESRTTAHRTRSTTRTAAARARPRAAGTR
jgi:hypothetical protein